MLPAGYLTAAIKCSMTGLIPAEVMQKTGKLVRHRPIVCLGSEDYSEWSLSISTVFKACGLLDCVTYSQVLRC